jgi:hypothetical protein
MQPIVVSPVQVSFPEYRQLYFQLSRRSLLQQAVLFLLPVVVIFGLIYAFANVKYLATPWFYGPPLVMVLVLLAAGFYLYLNRIRVIYNASQLATKTLSYQFSQQRFTVSSASEATLEVPWGAVAEAQRYGHWLLLLTHAPATHIVDLRQVQAPATEAMLLDLMRSKGIALS